MPLTVFPIVAWLLTAASGAAALIDEIVWPQWLPLVIGASTVSDGVAGPPVAGPRVCRAGHTMWRLRQTRKEPRE